MNARNFLGAVALVLLAYAVVVSAEAEAESAGVVFDCSAWEAGAPMPAAIQNLCRRQAILRSY
jgi:hypothetical protein